MTIGGEITDDRGTFTVTLYNDTAKVRPEKLTEKEAELLLFLKTPRSRQEITEYLGIGTTAYAMQAYINPLIEKGLVQLTIPDRPKSQKQRFVQKS